MSGEHSTTAGRPLAERPGPAAAPPVLVRPHVLAPTLAALACVALTVLTWRLLVGTTRGQLVEEAALTGSEGTRESLLGLAGFLLGTVSVPFLVLVLGGAVLASLLQRRWSIAVAAIVLLCGANLTTQVLQDQLQRPVVDAASITANSFPSGHATVGASIAATALLVVPVRWRPPVALLGTLVSGALGISTMIGDGVAAWHRTSDVIAAVLIVAAWYFAVEAVLAGIATRDGTPSSGGNATPARVKIPARILSGFGGLCAGLAIGALAATLVRVPITSEIGFDIAFAGSVLGVAAVVCFAQAAMLRLRPHHLPPRPADQV